MAKRQISDIIADVGDRIVFFTSANPANTNTREGVVDKIELCQEGTSYKYRVNKKRWIHESDIIDNITKGGIL